jgi:predicted nucleic acid-binding Zn ribbon protein
MTADQKRARIVAMCAAGLGVLLLVLVVLEEVAWNVPKP